MNSSNFDAVIRQNLMDPNTVGILAQLHQARAVDDRAYFDSILLGVISCVVPAEIWAEAIARASQHYRESRSK